MSTKPSINKQMVLDLAESILDTIETCKDPEVRQGMLEAFYGDLEPAYTVILNAVGKINTKDIKLELGGPK